MSQTDSDAQQDQDFDPTPDNPGLPRLVRVYLRQVVIGFALSAVFVGLLLGLNGLIFAGVQFGITIMRMAVSEDKAPRGGRRAPVAVAQPARVRVATGR